MKRPQPPARLASERPDPLNRSVDPPNVEAESEPVRAQLASPGEHTGVDVIDVIAIPEQPPSESVLHRHPTSIPEDGGPDPDDSGCNRDRGQDPSERAVGGMCQVDRFEDRVQEVLQRCLERSVHQSTHDRETGQHDERDGHQPGRFMRLNTVIPTRFTEEGEPHHPGHVERGQQGGHQPDTPQHLPQTAALEYDTQDLVLRPEAGEGRDARDGKPGDRHGGEGDRHLARQTTHLVHVLLARHSMDDRPRAEEQQRFEERMGHEVEHSGRVCGSTNSHEHVPQLADRRVGKHPLDVALGNRNGGGEQRGGTTDNGHGGSRNRGEFEDGAGPGDHVHPRGHHRGGMDQRRDRCRTFHRVRQPHVERKLGRLACCPDQQQQRDGGCHCDGQLTAVGTLEHRIESQRPEHREDQHQGEDETDVAHPVDDEGFLTGGGCGGSLEPE